jgi:hypothetical protein
MPPQALRVLVLSCDVEPGALAGSGKTRLQHLGLKYCRILGGAAGLAQLLSYLQHLQQLTHLILDSLYAGSDDTPPASGFSALTASSKLEFLSCGNCTMPADVWQHVFPAGRQLPHLEALDIWAVKTPAGGNTAAPVNLVSCCPGFAGLGLKRLQCTTELLASLSRLSGLRVLHVSVAEAVRDATGCICQLTGLRDLGLFTCNAAYQEGLMLQLTELRQLTKLLYCMDDTHHRRDFEPK